MPGYALPGSARRGPRGRPPRGSLRRVLLSDRDIRAQIDAGRVCFEPWDAAMIQPSSVDVRLDKYFRLFDNHKYPVIDPAQDQPELTRLVEVDPAEGFVLHPGEFVLGSTFETVTLPDDLAARVEGKSSLGRLGLLTHATAGFVDPADKANLEKELGLSQPIVVQYLNWIRDILRGDFGRSFFRSESVADMILRRGPLTAEIAFISVVLSWLVGIPVAVVSALRPNSIADSLARFTSILFIAVPGFWVGMLIVLGLLFWFGYRAPMAGVSFLDDPWSNLQIVLGPAIVLGLGQAAYIARMARSSLLEVIREDYVRTARAKGLNGKLVIALHALPNALLPVITLSGVLLGLVLAGSIPVERAFATPGLGYAMFTAVNERDVFVMQNLVFLYAVVFVGLNILVDVTIALLDPRIRYQ